MNKKKLSILIYSLACGGAERVVSILLNELKDKFDIILILMNDEIVYKIPKNQQIIYLGNSDPDENGLLKFLKLPFLGFKYREICKKNNIEISMSFMNRPNFINILAKVFGNRIKTIISERSMPSLQHKNGLQGFVNRKLIKFLYKKADIVIANSHGNRLDLKNNFFINNVLTINNPIENIPDKKISKNDKFTFVTIGRLDKGKNHKLIIEAMKDLDANLYIIGDGELHKQLSIQIKKLKLEDKVFLLGQQSNVFNYLLKSDCFVFSSQHEGFPNVLLEALSCMLPIISTDCKSGPREILAPGTDINYQLKNNVEICEYGILIPINDIKKFNEMMSEIMNNKKLLNKYIKNSKKRVKDFEKDKIIYQYSKVIEN